MAENNKNLTVYQKLFYLFGQGGGGVKTNTTNNKYSLTDKDLIVTKSREDFEKEKLQLQQQKYLQDQWAKVESDLYQKSVYYETSRLASYMDYESMEFTPEISVALDIFSEESCTLNEQGDIMSIQSDSKRIKNVLEDLFFNVLDIHSNLPMWTRNMCKYGDNFVHLKIDYKDGVIGSNQLTNLDIERRELNNLPLQQHNVPADGEKKKKEVKFVVKDKDIEFNAWEIAHFRLLGDDRKLPYGTSVLEKARRIWKQLCLDSETNVWTKNGYEKIKNIKKGDVILSYDYDDGNLVETEVKDCWRSGEKEVFNLKTIHNSIDLTDDHPLLTYNKVDKKYVYKNILELDVNNDYLVTPVKNFGETNVTKKILDEKNNFYIKLKPTSVGKIESNGIVKKCKEISFLGYKNIHGFLKGKRKTSIKNINKIMSIFNLTYDDFTLHTKSKIEESRLIKPDLNFTISEDFMEFFGFMLGDGWLTPNGIGFALGVDEQQNQYYIDLVGRLFNEKCRHGKPSKHSQYSKSIFIDSYMVKQIMVTFGFISGFSKKVIPSWVYETSIDYRRKLIKGIFDADGSYKWRVIGLSNEKLCNDLKVLCHISGVDCGVLRKTNGSVKYFDNKPIVRQDTFRMTINMNNFNDIVKYEKIQSIEPVGVREVWDIEVNNPLHNFVANNIVVHNCLAEDAMLVYRVTRAPERRVFKVYVGNIDDNDVESYVQKVANKFKRTQTADRQTGQTDIRYNTLAVDQDYFVPVRDPNASMPIETLPGASNLDQIADIQFIQRKLVTALRVPKTFLGFEDAVGEGKNLALLDIRFARTINRVQQAMIQELNKIAIIHLYILGFHDELNNFKLVLNNPSTQGEMLKVEQWKEKVLLYKDLVSAVDGGIAPTSHTWAKKNIFNWSADEILEDLEQQRLERAASKELEMTPEIIKNTGFFKKVDKLYGELPMDQGTGDETTDDEGGFGGDEGGFGGDEGGFGGGFGGDEGGFGGDEGGDTGFGESFRGDEDAIDRLLLEGKRKNEDIFSMTKGIDDLLNEENIDDNDLLVD